MATVMFRGLYLQRLTDVCRPAVFSYTRSLQIQTRTLSSAFRGKRQATYDADNRESYLHKCAWCSQTLIKYRFFSISGHGMLCTNQPNSKQTGLVTDDASKSTDNKEPTQKLSVFQRFKKTYKEHGKVLIGVHLVTSTVWFGSFFYAASVGVDVIPLMEYLGLSETIISPFRSSNLGNVALAYLMYKLATPARYTVTLAGTNYMVKYLRRTGKMKPKEESESLRALAKDSRAELKEKTGKIRSEMAQRKLKVRSIWDVTRQTKFRNRKNILRAKLLEKRSAFEQNIRATLKRNKPKKAPK